MARRLNRLFARLCLLAALTTAITLAVACVGYLIVIEVENEALKRRMPPEARAEVERLVEAGQKRSPRYYAIYDMYWDEDIYTADIVLLALVGLVSVAAGGGAAFFVARAISRPISAVSAAAARIASGDLAARASGGSGEVAELVARFNAMAGDIETYERERRVLTAGIAHELRTPLTILKGRLHGVIDGIVPIDQGEAARLLRQVEQLSRLVEDLRTLAHADAGELALDLRPVDAGEVLGRASSDLGAQAAAREVTFSFELAPAPVRADPVRLTQVFTNLLTNAIKHAPPGSIVTVTSAIEGSSAVMRVLDEGPGFDDADRARLFMPFWRAEENRTAGRPGSGMGLALAARLAELLGGAIAAENRAGGSGACFALRLPAQSPTVQRKRRRH